MKPRIKGSREVLPFLRPESAMLWLPSALPSIINSWSGAALVNDD